MTSSQRSLLFTCLLLIFSTSSRSQESINLSLEQVVDLALLADPWIKGSEFKESALKANAISAGELPDPVASFNILNLPTNGYSLSQEPMTQLKMGVSQRIPRGESLALRQQKLETLAGQHPELRRDRNARVRLEVSQIWLDLYLAQQSIALIEQDRNLFEQLGDVAAANYASALGRARQQDVIRANLELTRLEDRITALTARRDVASAKLTEWLGDRFLYENLGLSVGTTVMAEPSLPELKPLSKRQSRLLEPDALQRLTESLYQHPLIRAIDQRVRAGKIDVKLAQQLYKPQWNINAAYSWRDDDDFGNSRADLFSVGVSFDVPLFTERRQDKQVSASVANAEAIKTEKRLLLQKLLSGTQQTWASIQRLKERQSVYQNSILMQIHEQAEAALTAYTNDDGDFAEVVRARIDDLNARIDALTIDTELVKASIRLNYYFTDVAQSATTAGVYP